MDIEELKIKIANTRKISARIDVSCYPKFKNAPYPSSYFGGLPHLPENMLWPVHNYEQKSDLVRRESVPIQFIA